MYVGSLPELHLTAFGWMLYDSLWGLLAFVGLAIFPFTWTLFYNIYEAVKRNGITSPKSSEAAFHTIFPTFMLMMAVYSVACIPTVTLNVEAMEYTQLCTSNTGAQQASEVMTPGDTGTPLDTAAALVRGSMRPIDAQVPILWDIVMRVGAGVSRALNSGGACPTNTTYLDSELRKMTFNDTALQAELGQFAKDCYLPARSRYLQSMQRGTLDTVPTINDAVNPEQYFAAQFRDWRDSPPPNQENDELFSRDQDPTYIGSRFFLNTPGLYAPAVPGQYHLQVDTLKASVPVAGWSYDPYRDCQHNNAAAGDFCTNPGRNSDLANNFGSPTCDEWWTDANRGLLQKLRAAAESSIELQIDGTPISASDALNHIIATAGPGASKSDAWLADKMVATTLVNDTATQTSLSKKLEGWWSSVMGEGEVKNNGISSAGGVLGSMAALTAGAFTLGSVSTAASVGVAANLALHAIDFYTTAWIVRHAYPIAQAYLMLVFIATLPFMLIGSLFDVGRLLQFIMIFMTIQFLSPWRMIVEYLDERLFEIMFPDQFGALGTDLILKTPERALVDLTTTAMYTLVPLLLLWLVTLAGMGAAKHAGEAFNSQQLERFSSGSIRVLGGLMKGRK